MKRLTPKDLAEMGRRLESHNPKLNDMRLIARRLFVEVMFLLKDLDDRDSIPIRKDD